MNQTPATAVFEAARQFALDFYLSALLAPRACRDDLVTVAAFTGTLARIPLVIHEPLIGDIRLQWWRDWLATQTGDEETGNPVADAMGHLIDRHAIARAMPAMMLDAQTPYVYGEAVLDQHTFFRIMSGFYGTVLSLGCCVLTGTVAQEHSEVYVAAGRAYGTACTLTQLREFAARGIWPLPVETDGEVVGTVSSLVADRARVSGRRESVERAIAAARAELSVVQDAIDRMRVRDRAALRVLALVEPYFKAFEGRLEDPLLMKVDLSPLARRWFLWRSPFCAP